MLNYDNYLDGIHFSGSPGLYGSFNGRKEYGVSVQNFTNDVMSHIQETVGDDIIIEKDKGLGVSLIRGGEQIGRVKVEVDINNGCWDRPLLNGDKVWDMRLYGWTEFDELGKSLERHNAVDKSPYVNVRLVTGGRKVGDSFDVPLGDFTHTVVDKIQDIMGPDVLVTKEDDESRNGENHGIVAILSKDVKLKCVKVDISLTPEEAGLELPNGHTMQRLHTYRWSDFEALETLIKDQISMEADLMQGMKDMPSEHNGLDK